MFNVQNICTAYKI